MVPYFPDATKKQEYMWMDIYNTLGRQKRTIFVSRFLDDESCNQLIASMIWLQGQNQEEPITLYFNVPGSMIKPALAVYDVMRRMTCPIITINIGLTVGMGAILCSAGTPGQRYCFPNARFLMSRTGLEDGIEGQAVELSTAVKEVLKDNKKILRDFAVITKQSYSKIEQDLQRDFYLTAPEAAAYGVIDKVMIPHQVSGNHSSCILLIHFDQSTRS
jgi:ATP-dependent Clp protease, protease subunit